MPGVNPVMVEVLLAALVMVPDAGPLILLHVPTPMLGLLAAMVAVPGVSQMVRSAPANAVVGVDCTIILTSSELTAHTPLLMVHRKT